MDVGDLVGVVRGLRLVVAATPATPRRDHVTPRFAARSRHAAGAADPSRPRAVDDDASVGVTYRSTSPVPIALRIS